MSADSTADCTSFFDDLLDFQQDDNTSRNNAFIGSRCDSFPSDLWNGSPFSCFEFDPICSPDELFVPYENVVRMEMESLSTFVEDYSGGKSITRDNQQFPITENAAYGPLSVLESSSSSSSSCSVAGKIMPLCADNTARAGGLGRARSKRPRPQTFNPGLAHSFSNSPRPSVVSDGGNLNNESHHMAAGQKKKMKVKPSCPSVNQTGEMSSNKKSANHLASQSPAGVRKCLHCEITKTPQWRAGLMGPKTLCNACGVRHKSGRLFPEYRPSASPTFVQSLHSSSHKKVLEIRSTTAGIPTTPTPQVTTASDAQHSQTSF